MYVNSVGEATQVAFVPDPFMTTQDLSGSKEFFHISKCPVPTPEPIKLVSANLNRLCFGVSTENKVFYWLSEVQEMEQEEAEGQSMDAHLIKFEMKVSAHCEEVEGDFDSEIISIKTLRT